MHVCSSECECVCFIWKYSKPNASHHAPQPRPLNTRPPPPMGALTVKGPNGAGAHFATLPLTQPMCLQQGSCDSAPAPLTKP